MNPIAWHESWFRDVLENIRLLAVALDRDGRVTYCNDFLLALTGWTQDEVLGRDWFDAFVPADQPRRDLHREHVRAGTLPGHHEHDVLTRDGRRRTIAWDNTVLRDPGGDVVGTASIGTDVTERKQREAVDAIVAELTDRLLEGAPPGDLLQPVCERLIDAFGLPLAWIGLREPGGAVSIRARAGRAQGYLAGVAVRWDSSPHGQGPTGVAIRSGRPQTADPTADAALAPWRETAAALRLGHLLALPLTAGARTLGVLHVYTDRAEAVPAGTTELLVRLAQELAYGLVAAERQERIRLLQAALESAANAVVVTDRDGIIQWVNPAFTHLTGYGADEAVGQTPRILKSGSHGPAFYRGLWDTIERGEVWRGELLNRRKDGTLYPEEQTITPVRGTSGEITHFVAVKQDISERRQQEAQIVHLAMHDPLTDLHNRRAFLGSLPRLVARARRGRHSALLLLDLDHFKDVNDTLGHPAGDELLRRVAETLRAAVRPSDLVARLGGDEFGVILEDTTLDDARHAAERIIRALGARWPEVGDGRLELGVSIGLVAVDSNAEVETVLTRADHALYAAKQQGRNRVVVQA